MPRKLEHFSQNKEYRKIISAGGIVYRKTQNKQKNDADFEFLLLLHRHGEYWSFPKGRQIKGETVLETAKREIREETGVNSFKLSDKLSNTINFFVRRGKKLIPKEVQLFLVQFSRSVEVKLSKEHIQYKWLKYDDAIVQITHDNSKEVLSEAYEQLQNDE